MSVEEIRDYLNVDTLAYLSTRPADRGHRRGRRRLLRRLPHRRLPGRRCRSSLSKGVLEVGEPVGRAGRRCRAWPC